MIWLEALMAQLDVRPSDWRPGGRWGRTHSFMEIDHEIFSTVILSLPLIQEWQLSVSGERMYTVHRKISTQTNLIGWKLEEGMASKLIQCGKGKIYYRM